MEWRGVALDGLVLAPVLAFLGVAGGFVGVTPSPDLPTFARIAAIALVLPALGEELVFRALVLGPSPSTRRCALGIALFVAWHPMQMLIFGAAWGAVVFNPLFLCAVGALGLVLTRVYVKTRSIWPPVVLHWIVVLAWKLSGGPSPWA
jgi:predicted Abi (CAAX) family protease